MSFLNTPKVNSSSSQANVMGELSRKLEASQERRPVSPIQIEPKFAKELSSRLDQIESGRQRSFTVGSSSPSALRTSAKTLFPPTLKKESAVIPAVLKEEQASPRSTSQVGNTGKPQKEEDKFASIRSKAIAQPKKPTVEDIFGKTPSSSPAQSSTPVISPQFSLEGPQKMKAKQYSRNTKELSFDVQEKFGLEFLEASAEEQLNKIFTYAPLTAKEIEDKAIALVVASEKLFSMSPADRERIIGKLNARIFESSNMHEVKKNPNFISQCFDILLEFSLFESAAPFLCEFAEKMQAEDLSRLAKYIYQLHSQKKVNKEEQIAFLTRTLISFTEYDLKKMDLEKPKDLKAVQEWKKQKALILFRGEALSSKFTTILMSFALIEKPEFVEVVNYFNKKIKNHSKYVKDGSFTKDGKDLVRKVLAKIYALRSTNLENVKRIVESRSKAAMAYFQDTPFEVQMNAKKNAMIDALFLRGISASLQLYVHENTAEMKSLKSKLSTALQTSGNGNAFNEGSSFEPLNPILDEFRGQQKEFLSKFM